MDNTYIEPKQGETYDNTREKNKEKDSNSAICSELFFVFMPFVVIIIVFVYKGQFTDLLFTPEWALGASILFGQTIVKFITEILSPGKIVIRERVALFLSALIVFLFVPSLLVLALVLITTPPSLYLGISQIVLFVISVFVYWVMVSVGID